MANWSGRVICTRARWVFVEGGYVADYIQPLFRVEGVGFRVKIPERGLHKGRYRGLLQGFLGRIL